MTGHFRPLALVLHRLQTSYIFRGVFWAEIRPQKAKAKTRQSLGVLLVRGKPLAALRLAIPKNARASSERFVLMRFAYAAPLPSLRSSLPVTHGGKAKSG